MKRQVAVIGLGRFGAALAETLTGIGDDVLAIDRDPEKVEALAGRVAQAVQGDATEESFLRELDVGSLDVGVVAIGTSMEASVLATILLKNLGVPYVIARAETDLHGSILAKIGASQVVYPERQMGSRLAHVLTLKDVQDYIPVMQRYGVARLTAPAYLVGQTLAQAGFGRRETGVVALLILRDNEVIVTPAEAEVIKQGDILITVGSDDRLEELLRATRTGEPVTS